MKTLLKISLCFVLVFLGKNSFAQTNKLLLGTWVYAGSTPIQKYYTDADSVNFTDTIVFEEDYKFSNNKSKPEDVITCDYDSTEKLLIIMDMVKMDGVEYLIKTLTEKELIFDVGFIYRKIK